LPKAVSIEKRPKVVDRRARFGDGEGDTLVSSGRRGELASLVERKSGYTMLAGVYDLKSQTVRQATEQRFTPLPEILRRTMTFDNGKEFAEHPLLAAATGMSIYSARPIVLGSVAPMRTPMACCGSICQKGPTVAL
jgi:IS30 family transposase